MENDNSGIGSGANDIGGFEGSVSAEAPGSSTIESNMSANNGGGGPSAGSLDTDLQVSQPPDPGPPSSAPLVGSLDLDPFVIGAPIAVMDNRIDQPEPSFITANLTGADLGRLGGTVAFAAAALVAAVTGSPATIPLAVGAASAVLTNMEVLEKVVTLNTEANRGNPGAFATSVTHSTTVGDPLASTDQMDTPYWAAWGWSNFDQYMGFASDSGGGGGPG